MFLFLLVVALACYAIPAVTLTAGIVTTVSVGVGSLSVTAYVTETMTIPEIKAQYEEGITHLEALKNTFNNMATEARSSACEIETKRDIIARIKGELESSQQDAEDTLENDDDMFGVYYDALKEHLECVGTLCTDYYKIDNLT